MTSLGYTWMGGHELIWSRLYLETIYKLAALLGAPYLLMAGEWVDDTELEDALRLAGWTVHAPVRRRRLLSQTSYGALAAWKVVGEDKASSERALSAGWSELYQPTQLCAYILENTKPLDAVVPKSEAQLMSRGRVVMYDTDSLEVTVERGEAWQERTDDLLSTLADHMRIIGNEQGIDMDVYREARD